MARKMTLQPEIVPLKYAGKWIAWDRTAMKIIASGRTFIEVDRAVAKTGESYPIFEKVPRGIFGGFRL